MLSFWSDSQAPPSSYLHASTGVSDLTCDSHQAPPSLGEERGVPPDFGEGRRGRSIYGLVVVLRADFHFFILE